MMTANHLVKTDLSPPPGIRDGGAVPGAEGRDYQRAAEILRQASSDLVHDDAGATSNILNAARRICLACQQAHEEARWHGRALAEVIDREKMLERDLDALLGLIETRDAAASNDEPAAATAIPIEAGKRRNGTTGCGNHANGLRSRLRDVVAALHRPGMEFSRDDDVLVEHPAFKPDESSITRMRADVPPATSNAHDAAPSLAACCLGAFQAYLNDQLVADWRNGKAKSVFKYLLVHHDRPVSKEVLMNLFWPDADPDRARNSLNVTVYHIRRMLPEPADFAHVLFENDRYRLNPDLDVWIDAESFREHFDLGRALERHGDVDAAMREYRAADALYGGRFLEEDCYEDWVAPRRRALEDDYLELLDRMAGYAFERCEYDRCLVVCAKILSIDPCRESAHRRMMRCFGRQQEPYLAMRQFHRCAHALDRELQTAPSPATVDLVRRIRNRAPV